MCLEGWGSALGLTWGLGIGMWVSFVVSWSWGWGLWRDPVVLVRYAPWICSIACPRHQSGNFMEWMLSQWWYWGHMNAGQPGKGTTLPVWGWGLTEVSHHGTCQNFAFVLTSWLLGSLRPSPYQLVSRACLVTEQCGYAASLGVMTCLGLLVWTTIPVEGSWGMCWHLGWCRVLFSGSSPVTLWSHLSNRSAGMRWISGLPLQESFKFFCQKGGSIIDVEDAWGTILGYNFIESLYKGLGCFWWDVEKEGVRAEQVAMNR